MNTDMYFDPQEQCLARMAAFMESQPCCGMAGCRLYHADGSTAVISDFRPLETVLQRGNKLRFAPQGGRSSDGVMPFFNLALPGGNGAVVAINNSITPENNPAPTPPNN